MYQREMHCLRRGSRLLLAPFSGLGLKIKHWAQYVRHGANDDKKLVETGVHSNLQLAWVFSGQSAERGKTKIKLKRVTLYLLPPQAMTGPVHREHLLTPDVLGVSNSLLA